MEARTNKGPVKLHFTGGTWKELKNDMPADPLKAELVPYIAHIIATGKYAPERPAHFHPGVEIMHTYRAKVPTSAGLIEVVVDGLERSRPDPNQQKYQVYSLNHEGYRTYEKRQKESASLAGQSGPNRMRQKKPTQDSNAVVEVNISPQFEVVNLRIEDVTVDVDTIVANVTARLQEWMRREHEERLAQDAMPEGYGRMLPGCFTGSFAGLNRIRLDGEGQSWA